MSNIVEFRGPHIMTLGKTDYIKNKGAAQEMAEEIEDYYHRRGHKHIKVWVEERGMGQNREYDVRSNICFKVPSSLFPDS